MRMLFLLLAARSGAGVVGSELLQRCEWPRGVVLGLSRGRGHYAVLAAAHGAASSETESQQRLQAVQHNASCLSGAARGGMASRARLRGVARPARDARHPAGICAGGGTTGRRPQRTRDARRNQECVTAQRLGDRGRTSSRATQRHQPLARRTSLRPPVGTSELPSK